MSNNFLTLLGALFTVYVSFLLGSELLKRLHVELGSHARRFVYAVLLGYGGFGIAGFLLARVGLFSAPYAWVFVLLVLFATRHHVVKHLRALYFRGERNILFGHIKEWFKENQWLKILIVLWLLANIALVFVPLTGHDTLDYHFPVMQSLQSTGALTFTSEIPSYKFFPVLAEIIYTTPMVLFNETSAPFIFQLLQYSTLILLVILIYEFVRTRVKHSFLAPSSVLLTLSLMDLQREVMHGGYIDMMVLIFGVASMALMLDFTEGSASGKRELIFSALLLGFAMSMKYSSLIFALINCVLFLVGSFLQKTKVSAVLKQGFGYAFIALFISGFWYIKNALLFGSPVYPMFSDAAFADSVNSFILPRTFLNFFAFPFFAFGQWFVSDRESSSRLIPLIYFSFSYLSLIFLVFRRVNIDRVLWLLFGIIEIMLIFFFLTSHQIRFLLPVVVMFPVLVPLLGDKLVWMLAKTKDEISRAKLFRFLPKLTFVIFFLIFLLNFHYFEVKFRYLTGGYTKEEYIKEIGGQ